MKITKVRSILTAPEGTGLIVVKVETDQAGLYGVGCATFTQRANLVAKAVDEYLDPLLRGRNPANIEDIWQLCMVNSYWRNGPVLNNAISGVDMALWDIKGKVANMPVYDLFGGKCREAAMVYRHADGREPKEVAENVMKFRDEGFMAVRCQMGGYGGRMRDFSKRTTKKQGGEVLRGLERTDSDFPGVYYNPDEYARNTVKLFECVRDNVGDDLFLLHDIHERIAPIDAVRLAKALEPYRLFFLEDPLAPEQIEWFRRIREHAAVPIAMGELYVNPLEWRSLITEQLIDFIRVHISMIGGLTPARKLAIFCEAFGVRTAWHGPGDVSPVGHAANLHLDLSSHNFGIQEVITFTDKLREVFPGTPEMHDGHIWANDKPGLGIDIDEKMAAKYPINPTGGQFVDNVIVWTQARWHDGTIARP
jgi:mannonate dehydratase